MAITPKDTSWENFKFMVGDMIDPESSAIPDVEDSCRIANFLTKRIYSKKSFKNNRHPLTDEPLKLESDASIGDEMLLRAIAARNTYLKNKKAFTAKDSNLCDILLTYLNKKTAEEIARGEKLLEEFSQHALLAAKKKERLTLEFDEEGKPNKTKVEFPADIVELLVEENVHLAPSAKDIEPEMKEEKDELIKSSKKELDKITNSIYDNVKEEYHKIINRKPDKGSVAESQAQALLNTANKLRKINTEFHRRGLNSVENMLEKCDRYRHEMNYLLTSEEGIKFPSKIEKQWAKFKEQISDLGNWFRKKLGMSDPSKHKVAVPLSKEEFQESIGKAFLLKKRDKSDVPRIKERVVQQAQRDELEVPKENAPTPKRPKGY